MIIKAMKVESVTFTNEQQLSQKCKRTQNVQIHLTVHQSTNPWSFQVRVFPLPEKISVRILTKQLLLFLLHEKKYETIFQH